MTRTLNYALLLVSTLLAGQAIADKYAPVDKLPQGSRSSLLVEDLQGNNGLTLTNNSDQFFPPASTLKLVTALAAKLELGDQFHYQTTLAKAGNDLVFQFSGDPTLTTKDLANMLSAAKQQKLTRITGDIWLDDSAFSGYERAIGWPWDILGVCYSAPASAITLDENCIQASIYTQDNGKTRVYVPEQYPVYVSTSVKTVTRAGQKAAQCDLELLTHPDNHYQLRGCLVSRKQPLPLKFAVQDTRLYATRMIYTELNRLGIKLDGKVKVGRPNAPLQKTLAVHYSAPLPQLLDEMLKKSDNLIADSLTKSLGAQFFIQPGSFKNGTAAIKQIIFAHTGIDLKHAQLADGSGLSRNNRFTAHDMAAVLRYIYNNDHKLHIIDMMPKAGESGTLHYRRSMRKAPIKGQMIAKSGSLYGSYNMAGYGLDKNGKPNAIFVQFVSDYHPVRRDDEQPVVPPITQFETLFYQDVINYSQAK